MNCQVCGQPCTLKGILCFDCLIDLYVEAGRNLIELTELFRSELNEPTEAIWQRITR